MEYQIKLLTTNVTKVNAAIDIQKAKGFQIEQERHTSVFEPKDPSDPTVMVRTECTLKDPSGNHFFFSLTADFIFEFDSIPDDWSTAVSENCPQLITDKINDLTVSILHSMGHNLSIVK